MRFKKVSELLEHINENYRELATTKVWPEVLTALGPRSALTRQADRVVKAEEKVRELSEKVELLEATLSAIRAADARAVRMYRVHKRSDGWLALRPPRDELVCWLMRKKDWMMRQMTEWAARRYWGGPSYEERGIINRKGTLVRTRSGCAQTQGGVQ